MRKIGRNDPCPCGSGKKHKNCCQGIETTTTQPLQRSVSITVPAGLPGVRLNLIACSRWKEPDPRNDASPNGTPGRYQVTFVLGRPGAALMAPGSAKPAEVGDSYILLPQSRTAPSIELPQLGADFSSGDDKLHWDGYANSHGRLARLVLPSLDATGFSDAELRAQRVIQKLLSQLAVRFNVPITIESEGSPNGVFTRTSRVSVSPPM